MTFQDQLDEAFHGRFRIRWSDKRQEWHLEQKVATGQVIEPPKKVIPGTNYETGDFDTYDDAYVRARDGYFFTMAIRNGDRMPCPVCGYTVHVPFLETRETRCERCEREGRDGMYAAAFFPLNHLLIEHLRFIDPLTDGIKRVRDRMRSRQIAKVARDRELPVQQAGEMLMDDKWQAFGTPRSYGAGTKHAPANLGAD